MRLQLLPWLCIPLLLGACAAPRPGGDTRELSGELVQLRRAQEDLGRTVETLVRELETLQGQVGEQQTRLSDLNWQVEALSRRPAGAAPAAAPETAPAPAAQSPTEVYQQAFADYASGRFTQAVQGFTRFLQLYPDNRYAGNAQFWLAESYFSLQDYRLALDAYERVVTRFPDGGRAADALLQLVKLNRRLQLDDVAERYAAQLTSRYPDSPAARKLAQESAPAPKKP